MSPKSQCLYSRPSKIRNIKAEFPIFHTGYYESSIGNKVEITKAMIDEIVSNFKKKVCKRVCFFDGHWGERKSRGVVTNLRAVLSKETEKYSLMATPAWSQLGIDELEKGAWLCVSIERKDICRAPAVYDLPSIVEFSKKKNKNTLAFFEKNDNDSKQEDLKMNELLEKLGVENEEEAMKKITEMIEMASEYEKMKEKLEKETKEDEKMAEDKDKMSKELESLKKELFAQKRKTFETERDAFVEKLFSEGKITKAQFDSVLKMDEQEFSYFKKFSEQDFFSDNIIPKKIGTSSSKKKEIYNDDEEFDKLLKDENAIDQPESLQ